MALFSITRRSSSCRRLRRDERGYVLLIMMMAVAVLAVGLSIALPAISFTIRRDNELEMVHRGVQYSRAIRTYYKKFGRYPTRLEDLENTNNLRFLRKRYKDPLTGKDFRLLHYGEPGVTLGGSIGGGVIPGASPAGSPGGLNNSGSSAQPSTFGGSSSTFGGNSSTFGGSSSTFGGNSSTFGGNSSTFGGNSNSTFGSTNNSTNGSNASGPNSGGGTGGQASSSPDPDDSSSAKVNSAGASDQSSGQQPVAGGPIVGVASNDKKTTIREYNHKKKYNEWQFVYDPTTDRGGLITTPNQPSLQQGFAGQPLQPASGGSSNSFGQPSSSGFGNQSSGFGNSGFGSQSSGFGNSGYGNNSNSNQPAPPPSPSPQQQ